MSSTRNQQHGRAAANEEQENLLTTKEAAHVLRVHAKTLVRWRGQGGGPDFEVLGARTVRYRRRDIARYLNHRTYRHTSEYGVNPKRLYRAKKRDA
jgi:excisionase family DNA binding protein